MPRFYLEMTEEGHRIPVGNATGYETLLEAKKAAKARTDDALPRNRVRVYLLVTEAYLGGDGGSYVTDEE